MRDLMSFAALAYLSAVISLDSVIRFVGYALFKGPEIRYRPWHAAICCVSYLVSLAMRIWLTARTDL